MWNDLQTGAYEGMIAETVSIPDQKGNTLPVYWSRPLGREQYPSIVLIPHMPGWDEWCRETARRFTQHGYGVMCPNIYHRAGEGTPSEVAKRSMEAGGQYDADVMDDTKSCLDFLKMQKTSNGKVGVIGMCSGGRHAFMAACLIEGFDAAVDCWGGGVVQAEESLKPQQPVSPHTYTEKLNIPLLGIFGNDDKRPDVNEVNALEEELKKYGKNYEFHRYDEAGHGIWYYDKPMYRQEAAMDSFNKTLDFFDRYLNTDE